MPDDLLQFVDVTLSWSRTTAGPTAILKRLDAGPWAELARVAGTTYVVTGLSPERAYVFAAAAVLSDGTLDVEPNWEVRRVAPMADAGRPIPPSAPTGFAVAQDGPTLHARWDAATDGATARYELRRGTSWEDAVLVAEGLSASPYSWPWWSSGAQTYLLKAIDRFGRASREAASVAVVVAPLETHVTAATADEGAGGWTGTKSHVETDSGALRLERLPACFGARTQPFGSYDVPCFARYWATGTYETAAVDVGQAEAQRVEVDLGAAQPTDAGLPFGAVRRRVLGSRRRRDGTLVRLGTRGFASKRTWRGTPLTPVDVLVEIDTSQSGVAPWDGWRPYVPGTYVFQRVRLRTTLRGDGLKFVKLPKFVVTRRKFNWKDEGDVALPGAAAIEVTFAAGFTGPPKVAANVVGVIPAATFKIEITTVTKTKCKFEVFAAGVSVAATLHWHAMGV